MTLTEYLTLITIITGPISAVLITLWIDARRKKREQRVILFRHLLATRHLPADPAFLASINLIPIEFNDESAVMNAYSEFITATAAQLDGINDLNIQQNTSTKLTRLIFEISRSLGFKIRETDIQTSAYASDGWVKRELLNQDSQQAMRDIANILWMQTRLAAGELWEDILKQEQAQNEGEDKKQVSSKKSKK